MERKKNIKGNNNKYKKETW